MHARAFDSSHPPDKIQMILPPLVIPIAVRALEIRSAKSNHDIRRLPARMPTHFRAAILVSNGIAAAVPDEGGAHVAPPFLRVTLVRVSVQYVLEIVRRVLEDPQTSIG